MFSKIYLKLREIKWNLKTSIRIFFVAWNFWDFLFIHRGMGHRTARLWGGGKIFLRNYYDVQILLEVFENSYSIDTYYPTVADIGANIGIFSVFYARRFPSSKIDAYEPEPNNFRLLVKNTSLYPNIVCHNVAIGSERAEMTLYMDKKNLGRHSLRKGWARHKESVIVSVEPLIKRFDFIKMDVEGAEYDILQTIPDCKRMVMEIHEIEGESQEKLIEKLSSKFEVTDLGGHVFSLQT